MLDIFKNKYDILESVINKKQNKEKIEIYNKNIEIFKIIEDFIVSNNLIIYGGAALNSLLPEKDKFYDKYDLPDYDVFCVNPKDKGIELANILKTKGYKYIEFKDAIHEGTYKLFVDFIAVLDLTETPLKFYNYMIKNAEKDLDTNILICPIELLKWSLYNEMASPKSSIHRWTKLFKRINIINKKINIKNKIDISQYKNINNGKISRTQIKDIIKNIKMYDSSFIIIGDFAINYFTKIVKKINYLELISEEPEKIINTLSNIFNINVKKSNKIFEFVPQKYTLFDSNNNIFAIIYKIPENKCYSYSYDDKLNFNIGTIDTTMTFLYSNYIENEYKNLDNRDIYFKILIFEKIIKILYKNPRYRFNTECIGTNISLIEQMKKNWDNKAKKFIYKPLNDIHDV